MMQELRLVLIVLGALAIAALLLHGLWTNKKEKTTKFGEKPLGKLDDDNDAQRFDQDGIGAVRVVSSTKGEKEKPARQEPAVSFGDKPDVDPLFAGEVRTEADTDEAFYPSMSATDDDAAVASESVTASNESNGTNGGTFTDTAPSSQPDPDASTHTDNTLHDAPQEQVKHEAEQEETPDDTEVLVLHVHANNNAVFSGLDLIPTLEQYGLRFGDMGIYHRHSDLSGSGKVLFSVANMVKPGTFDVSHSESFETPGISFFMTLPCYGEPEQNFKLMLQTAQQIADELGGLVLDDARSMMTPSRLDEYRERVKAFNAS
ncbi:cell division protein ZipA [Salinivibrio sp. ES.052]|uniref:cell division protein ZipA n=1 Tax=Salinivibrio sp. ES.052 TaxID=1882823 RepID=UPI00094099FD|nr:cell division protein ZipA [Salinivibrio sp. ES.052]